MAKRGLPTARAPTASADARALKPRIGPSYTPAHPLAHSLSLSRASLATCADDYYHNFYLQLQGTKHFAIFPPAAHAELHLHPAVHPAHRSSQLSFPTFPRAVDPANPTDRGPSSGETSGGAGIFDLNISQFFVSLIPPDIFICAVLSCPCLSDANWCLQFDILTNLRPQAAAVAAAAVGLWAGRWCSSPATSCSCRQCTFTTSPPSANLRCPPTSGASTSLQGAACHPRTTSSPPAPPKKHYHQPSNSPA